MKIRRISVGNGEAQSEIFAIQLHNKYHLYLVSFVSL